jgi:uncharacterized protein YdiU (UPF0061 family)
MSLISSSFDTLTFDNRFVAELPADPIAENNCRQVPGALFSRVKPFTVRQPELLAFSPDVLDLLGLDQGYATSEEFVQTMAGNRLAKGMDPYASCYAGHQFGNWAGQLGDGRAINLGEIVNPRGERWAMQLKGAGPTPYSRRADGFAVLRSSVREFLCSEAMFHLGVPTTGALSLVTTGEAIPRDMFYDGNVKSEPGAVVCRVAPSFTRFGHFENLSAQHNLPLLKQFIDYTLRTDFPHLGPISNETIALWFTEVCERTAEMIAHWMRVGFVHGVMNTDNMSILGLTIDYGPYGWLDNYDPDWTPNTTDAQNKRYRYGNQPTVAHWNLLQLAQSLAALTEEVEPMQVALDRYAEHYQASWSQMLSSKLGLENSSDEAHKKFLESCPEMLQMVETDMTIFFRQLAKIAPNPELSDEQLLAPLRDAYYAPESITAKQNARTADWLRKLIQRWNSSGVSDASRIQTMNAHNPKYVLRNYLAQLAIDKAEKGDYSMIHELQTVLEKPYETQAGKAQYAEKRPDWARDRAGCSMLSCSS